MSCKQQQQREGVGSAGRDNTVTMINDDVDTEKAMIIVNTNDYSIYAPILDNFRLSFLSLEIDTKICLHKNNKPRLKLHSTSAVTTALLKYDT